MGDVLKVDGEVGGEDGLLDDAEGRAVLGLGQVLEDPVAVEVEDDDGLVEVVLLQGRGRVEAGQGGVAGKLKSWSGFGLGLKCSLISSTL